MFKDNMYVDTLIDDKSFKDLDWDEFYNAHSFIKALPSSEKVYLSKPSYWGAVYLYPNKGALLHLTRNGYVEDSENFTTVTNGKINDRELIGMHLKEVYSLLIERGIRIPKDNEIAKTIDAADRKVYFKEELLNSIMYKIIERGGNIIGPRRGYLFAKEFNRNLDIPMMYGASTYDSKNVDFANQYLDDGGNSDLECYNNYFFKNDRDNVKVVTVEDIINERALSRIYYDEVLHRVEQEKNEQIVPTYEDVKRRRLERKLEKSRNRMNNY